MNTVKLSISVQPKDPWSDILIAELSENGFDSFEYSKQGIIAYGSEDQINLEVIKTNYIETKKLKFLN